MIADISILRPSVIYGTCLDFDLHLHNCAATACCASIWYGNPSKEDRKAKRYRLGMERAKASWKPFNEKVVDARVPVLLPIRIDPRISNVRKLAFQRKRKHLMKKLKRLSVQRQHSGS